MMKKLRVVALLLATFAASAESVVSSNTYGFLKVVSGYTNTIISVPWKGYTQDGLPTLDLRADRLVKPKNLTTGDELLLLGPDNQTFASWVLAEGKETIQGAEATVRHWQPRLTARKRTDGTSYIDLGADTNVVVRGYGLWLIRQNPVVNGVTNAFYLHGQWTSGGETVTIGGTGLKGVNNYLPAVYTMMANPDCTKETVINGDDMPWKDMAIGKDDSLILNTDAKTTKYCTWKAGKGWRTSHLEKQTIGGISVSKTVYDYDLKVPAGVGFWYVRRTEGDLTFTWPARGEK